MKRKALSLIIALTLVIGASSVLADDSHTLVLKPAEVQSRYMDLDTVPVDLQIMVDLQPDRLCFVNLDEVQAQTVAYVDLTAVALLQQDCDASLK